MAQARLFRSAQAVRSRLQFQTPILNHPNNLYGYDFTIFGNSGFIITNDFDLTTFNWIGIPATDGSLFAENEGSNASVGQPRWYGLL